MAELDKLNARLLVCCLYQLLLDVLQCFKPAVTAQLSVCHCTSLTSARCSSVSFVPPELTHCCTEKALRAAGNDAH